MEDLVGRTRFHHHTDDVEADIGVKVEGFRIRRGGTHQFAAFGRTYGLLRITVAGGHPGLHLHHHEFSPLSGHDVQFITSMAPIAVKDGESLLQEPLARQLLPGGA